MILLTASSSTSYATEDESQWLLVLIDLLIFVLITTFSCLIYYKKSFWIEGY